MERTEQVEQAEQTERTEQVEQLEPMGDAGRLVEKIRRAAEAHRTVREGDHVGPDGLVVCGTCGEPKQIRRTFGGRELILWCTCRCDQEEMAAQARRVAEQEAMRTVRELRSMSMMNARTMDATFDNWKITKQNRDVYQICRNYAEHFEDYREKGRGLIFWGTMGTGKSYAAGCIANCLLDRQIPVVMTSFVRILADIQCNAEAEARIMYGIRSAKLVILDDLGAERNTPYALEKVYGIVNELYQDKKCMILTTNLTMDELESTTTPTYGRIYSRILECCEPIQFVGEDWRKRQAKANFSRMEGIMKGAGGS